MYIKIIIEKKQTYIYYLKSHLKMGDALMVTSLFVLQNNRKYFFLNNLVTIKKKKFK